MTVNTLVKVAEILGISMDSLFTVDEDKNVIMNNIIALLKGKSQSDLEIV